MPDNKNRENNNVGFVDDYASSNIQSSGRNNNGHVMYTNALANERKPKRRVTKMSRRRYRMENTWLVAIIVFLCLVTAVSVGVMTMRYAGGDSKNDIGPADYSGVPVPVDTLPEDAEENDDPTLITVSNDEIHSGNLILVNYKYAYVFPEGDILTSMFNTEKVYSVNATETYLQKEALENFKALTVDLFENSGCDDILVSSAFRTIEKQKEIYQDRLDRYGSEYAAAYVADPGYSEHHTGLCLDLSVLADDGYSYDIETYADAAWFMDNYKYYGFILRYPVHKAAITSIDYEGWHYRYVGLPHSVIIAEKDLCLEEYIDYLRAFTYDGNVLIYSQSSRETREVSADGYKIQSGEYLIYFVPASDGDETEIPVFEEADLTVSGNNVDGFIVTAMRK